MADAAAGGSQPPRRYHSPRRLAQAEATSNSICRAAAALFADRGYANTSVREIASAAGVAVETVYAIGGKADVFLRTFELAFTGTPAGASLLELDGLRDLRAAGTLEDFVALVTRFIVLSNERSAGLWSAYTEAANADPVLAAAYSRRMQDMRTDGERVLDESVALGLCRRPADVRRTVDRIWLTYHPSQYVLLVTHAGWSTQEYESWMSSTVLALFSD